MQIVLLDLDHDNLFCPATGNPLFDENGDLSPAIDFVFIHELGEIVNASPVAQTAWDAIDDREEDVDYDRFERFVASYDAPNLICFEITTHGFANGPVWSTVSVGIDMNYDIDANVVATKSAADEYWHSPQEQGPSTSNFSSHIFIPVSPAR